MSFNRKLLIYNVPFMIIAIIIALLSIKVSFIHILEFKVIDIETGLYNIIHPISDSNVVIIDIDDNSYQMLQKRFPWPRSYYGRLVRNLNDAGVKLIVFDIEFDVESSEKEDMQFANILKRYNNVILASKISFYSQNNLNYQTLIMPIKQLGDNALSIGLINIPYDPDGIVRHYFKNYAIDNNTIPSLSYSVINALENDSEIENNLFNVMPLGIPGYIQRYSFWSVIDDSTFQLPETDVSTDVDAFYEYLDDQTFKDKIVFVGSSLSELHDYIPCYYQTIDKNKGLMSGVEYHASAFLTLFHNRKIDNMPFYLNIVLMIILGSIVVKSFKRKNVLLSSVIEILLLFIVVLMALYFFVYQNIQIILLELIVFITLIYLFNIVFTGLELRKERALIKHLFQHYVSEDVVNKLIVSPDKLNLGGEVEELSVLFTDIEGFTTICETLKPDIVTKLLNEYLTIVTDIIIKNGGMIDKYEGDAVMAVFGAPIPLENHAYSAVKTGIKLLESQGVIDQLSKKYNVSQLRTRIGINTGEMLIGNMGTMERLNYTVMGDSVNLASRLESINKFYHSYLMYSKSTENYIKNNVKSRFVDTIVVKGKTETVDIYQPMNIQNNFDEELLLMYHNSIELYRNRKFKEALREFEIIFEKTGDYITLIYIDRCKKYIDKNPEDDWKPVEIFHTK